MDHFIDIYNKKTKGSKYCENLLNSDNIKVNLKVDGKPFQVLYNKETDEIEWHGRSGNETKVGPIIDDYTKLFSKSVNDAIAHLENKKDIIKKYKFLTFEVIDNMLLLTAVISNNDEFINDAEDILKVSKELDTDVMPTLWQGKLNNEQKESILQILSTGIVPEKNDFIDWLKQMFGTYKLFPKKLISAADDFVEGIVLFFELDEKIIEYKIVDPTYRQLMKDRDAKNSEFYELYKEQYEKCYNILVDYFSKNAKKLDNNHIKSMQLNYLNFINSNYYKNIYKIMSTVDIIENNRYGIQKDQLITELKNKLNDKVDIKIFELFIKTFYKEKKRSFIISKEFQNKINNIVNLMESLNNNYYQLKYYLINNLE